ncbi:TAT-variant-translocated molybdopterin oxidoreductase [Methylocaldum sp.]|uniref:TAT-variant-translocated molybdopterin oxidoreductase n=1 Tax=Methylocaldum sp. TaxID=1969727 RepID=UPI002D277629|nr:TAT-variant-translocated molybdopterin oxidoreductase [Methylocaldum sp.]HYE34586.1 TAT-variant-translocated molybdopterin oxidoreductase [Methylocaldum sp.]
MSMKTPGINDNFAALNALLTPGDNRPLWRSLEELADTDTFREFADREFPEWTDPWLTPVKRRRLLQLMAASLVFGGLGGCGRQPREEIVPYVREPEQIVPGKPLYFATALTHGGFGQGVVVESHMGRPTKVEGNPLHPASLGATDIFSQAAVLSLYDPDRSQTVTNGGQLSNWQAFVEHLSAQKDQWAARRGAGLYILTETFTSPTLGQQLNDFLRIYPEARWHQYDPVGHTNIREGARLAFGEEVDTLYRFDQAAVILSLDCDFLTDTPARTRYGHDFVASRRVRRGNVAMNRLYVLESTPTLAGAMADHRLPVQAGRMEAVTRALAAKLGRADRPDGEKVPVPERWLDIVTRDLSNHRGNSVVIAGEHLPPAVHALVQAINQQLGNFGRTVFHIEPIASAPADNGGSLPALLDDILTGGVQTLIILGGNPVYATPADLEFGRVLRLVPLRIHWGLYADETAELCHWHIPALHELESWSDAKAYDGTVSLVQPLIAPLYGGRSVHELMALLLGQTGASDHDLVQAYWRTRHSGPDFEMFWKKALRDGVVPDTAGAPKTVSARGDLGKALLPSHETSDSTLEIRFRQDPSLWDGRYANNGWLQELPKPLTKLTWENAVLLSPKTAKRLDFRNGDLAELLYRERQLIAPVWIMAGHADDSATLYLGYGRNRAGHVGNRTGFDAYRLRASDAPWFDYGLEIRKTGRPLDWLNLLPSTGRAELATTQRHHTLDGRDLVKVLTPKTLASAGAQSPEHRASLYPEYRYEGYAWAMVIDLNACIGCNACVVACQAENNVPIVGKDEVRRGREMHWLRVDRYYAGEPDNPETYFQPVPCMHCEKAPCEPVCPVQASIHDSEGLNNQVYNRCVGTRFCQSNCPYKVRRFNFFGYAEALGINEGAPSVRAVRNPDVTVRSRGVMEKCTYCVQRISAARIAAEQENRRVRDGEVQTACQAACPTQAIIFGDLNVPGSQVAALRTEPHHYALLAELNTQPRTTYLARLRNPNPEFDDEPES